MRGVQDAHDRFENLKGFCGCEPSTLFQFSIERVTLHIFHHHVDGAVARCSQIVNSYSVSMPKPSRCLALTTESAQPVCVVAYLWREDFYRDAIPQQYVTSKINRSHA